MEVGFLGLRIMGKTMSVRLLKHGFTVTVSNRTLSKAIRLKGSHFLEAPVSGSRKPAEEGQLIILAAGEKALYEQAVPAFDVMGKKSFFLGPVGNAARTKLVKDMIMGW